MTANSQVSAIVPSRSPLISATELSDQLGASSSGPGPVLDVRWTLSGSDKADYLDAHIPGAVFIDLDRELAGPPGPGGRHPLPDPVDLQEVWRAAGIDDGSPVVVYDGGNGLAAARAWWLLRWSGLRSVRVLDGGFAGWAADPDRPIGSGEETTPRPGRFRVRPGAMPVVDADRAAELATSASAVLIDARAGARYRGEVEPVDPIAGHIPGSVNLPISDLLTTDGTFRPVADLVAAFDSVGVHGGAEAGVGSSGVGARGTGVSEVGVHEIGVHGIGGGAPRAAASCGSGVTACQLILAGELAGVQLALFPGSYSQWCALGRPVAVGATSAWPGVTADDLSVAEPYGGLA